MNRLICNLRNIKRPIRGVIPNKRIVRDELGVELALPIYTRIKKDCNVYAVINRKEYIIPTEADFKKFLLKADNPVKENAYEAPNRTVLPNILKKDENDNLVDTGKTVEEAYAYNNHPVENTEEPETLITATPVETDKEVPEEEETVEEYDTDSVENKAQNNNQNKRKNKNRR